MVNVTLEGLWMVSERIVDFRFSVKFLTGPEVKHDENSKLSHVLKTESYSMSRPVKLAEKIKNWQSYHKPSIILPRIIPIIMMRPLDMLG